MAGERSRDSDAFDFLMKDLIEQTRINVQEADLLTTAEIIVEPEPYMVAIGALAAFGAKL